MIPLTMKNRHQKPLIKTKKMIYPQCKKEVLIYMNKFIKINFYILYIMSGNQLFYYIKLSYFWPSPRATFNSLIPLASLRISTKSWYSLTATFSKSSFYVSIYGNLITSHIYFPIPLLTVNPCFSIKISNDIRPTMKIKCKKIVSSFLLRIHKNSIPGS